MPDVVRILFVSDTHLGFDLPITPRIKRRRRGHDFLANYGTALRPALAGEVDLVVHGGDVFNRSRPVPSLAYQAFEPLSRVADRGIPVFIVPGNHERGRLPHLRFAKHPGIHVFDEPRTFVAEVRGARVVLAGFPSERDAVRARFIQLLDATRWRDTAADVRLLCLHQCIEGSTVGPGNYTFTTARDVVRCADIPQFQSLPARPLVRCTIDLDAGSDSELDARLRALLTDAPSDAVLTIHVGGTMTPHAGRLLSATTLRSLAPPTMNVEVRLARRAEATR